MTNKNWGLIANEFFSAFKCRSTKEAIIVRALSLSLWKSVIFILYIFFYYIRTEISIQRVSSFSLRLNLIIVFRYSDKVIKKLIEAFGLW
jgi:hypothetical protein